MLLSGGTCIQKRIHNAGTESAIVLIGLFFCQRHVDEFLAYISRKYLVVNLCTLYAFYFQSIPLAAREIYILSAGKL